MILSAISVPQSYCVDMFDTVWGVPVHIIIVHLLIVVGPLTSGLAIAFVVRPAWRRSLRLPVLVGAVLTGLAALVAGESGDQLQRRVLIAPQLIDLSELQLHTRAGDIAKVLSLVFMVVAVVVVTALGPRVGEAEGRAVLQRTGLTLLAVLAAVTLVSLVVTLQLGVRAAWSDTVQESGRSTALFGG